MKCQPPRDEHADDVDCWHCDCWGEGDCCWCDALAISCLAGTCEVCNAIEAEDAASAEEVSP